MPPLPFQTTEKQIEFHFIHNFVENPVGNASPLNGNACMQGHWQPFA
jgi:hypothetical protein